MKLRLHNPWSLNGNILAPDEFGYIIGSIDLNPTSEIREIALPCRGGKYAGCVLRIRRGAADEATGRWGWDGNMEEPTLTPSIACDRRCGWHGTVVKGEMLP